MILTPYFAKSVRFQKKINEEHLEIILDAEI